MRYNNKLVSIFIIFFSKKVWDLFLPTSSSKEWMLWIEFMIHGFLEDEFRRAIQDCDSSKSPSPERVEFGEIIKDNCTRVMSKFHGQIYFFSFSFQKKIVKDLRIKVISLIGCICKVISKTLTNRLKPSFRRHNVHSFHVKRF